MLTALLACSLLAAGPRPSDSAEPRVVERRFASELDLTTDSFEIEAAEDEKSVVQQGPRLQREEASEVEIDDTLQGDGESPARFTRHYRTVMSSLSLSGDGKPLEKTVSAGLQGKRVTFERDERGRYARSSDDEGVRQVQLNRLRAELSLARFLPSGDGGGEDGEDGEDTLALPFADFMRILAPLEEHPRRPNPKGTPPPGGLNIAPTALMEPIAALLAGAEGELTITPRARTEEDELPRNAALAFRFEGVFDGSATLVAAAPGEAEDEVAFLYEGTGTLAWDPAGGRIELRCEGELRLDERFLVVRETGGKQGRARGRLCMTGTLALEASESE